MLYFEGNPLPVRAGDTVAATLLKAGVKIFSRSVKYHRPRGPYCFAAACSNCLMRIDGVPSVMSCRKAARDQMQVERQNGFPRVDQDWVAATNLVFPNGFNHHTFLAGTPVLGRAMQVIARQLSGVGKLPDAPPAQGPEGKCIKSPVAVVGSHPAAFAAAERLTNLGVPFLHLNQEEIIGFYPSNGSSTSMPVLMAVTADDTGQEFPPLLRPQLLRIEAQAFILAQTGCIPLPVFENNDLPGIFTEEAISSLSSQSEFVPGKRFFLIGDPSRFTVVQNILEHHRAQVVGSLAFTPDFDRRQFKAIGRSGLRAVSFTETIHQKTSTVPCDALVIARAPEPAFQLAHQAGAAVRLNTAGSFEVDTDSTGRTSRAGIWCAADQATGRLAAAELSRELP